MVELLEAIARLSWPVVAVVVILTFRRHLSRLLGSAQELSVDVMGNRIVVKAAQGGMRPPAPGIAEGEGKRVGPIGNEDPLPADYLYLSHITFLREARQKEFRKRTNCPGLDHYDIRVVLDSYYDGALERVQRVEYLLHESYPEPAQVRGSREDHFMLKELANGEYVLLASVYLRDRPNRPLILQRYITLGGMDEMEWREWLAAMS